jgi:hypothetical protein
LTKKTLSLRVEMLVDGRVGVVRVGHEKSFGGGSGVVVVGRCAKKRVTVSSAEACCAGRTADRREDVLEKDDERCRDEKEVEEGEVGHLMPH